MNRTLKPKPTWRVWKLDGSRLTLDKDFYEEDRTAADRYAWEQLCASDRDVIFTVHKGEHDVRISRS